MPKSVKDKRFLSQQEKCLLKGLKAKRKCLWKDLFDWFLKIPGNAITVYWKPKNYPTQNEEARKTHKNLKLKC